jgi:hypothetical protein
MWLAHHWPDAHDRCVELWGRRVCRRCLVLYPLALLAAVVIVLVEPPSGVLVAMIWILPAPVALEWVLEHLGRAEHRPRRLVATTALAAPALGAAFALHAQQPFRISVVAPVVAWTSICLAASLWRAARPVAAGADWERRHDDEEAARTARLRSMLGLDER